MKYFTKKLKIAWWRIKSISAMYYYGHPSRKLKIIGVTGTNGKTTIATLLYRVTTTLGYKAGLVGTVENVIAGEKKEVTHTTPDSMSMTKLFKEMVDKGCKYVFIEVSSHALDQNRVWRINFDGGVFTNLTHDHLDYHKTFNNYFNAKKKFFNSLPSDAFALSNADDKYGKKMLEGINARKFLYEFSNIDGPASIVDNFIAKIIRIDFQGIEIQIGDNVIKSKLLGKFNAYNLLAVWSTLELLGFDMKKVKSVLEEIEPPCGRFEHFVSPNGVLAIIDYAHTPDALEKVLLTSREILPKKNRLIAILGCGGDRDPLKRPKMGKIGAELSDIAIFTSDNPRSENPKEIIEEMHKDLTTELSQKVKTILNRREAIAQAVGMAQKGDIILCAGKGHEDYQEIKGVKHHFSDREEFEKVFS